MRTSRPVRAEPARRRLRTSKLRSLITALGVAALALSLLTDPRPAAAAAGGTVVATIGNDQITSGEFIGFLKSYVRAKLYHGGSPERLQELAEEALDQLIMDRLLTREAERRGIAGDPGKVAKRRAEIERRYQGKPEWEQIEPNLAEIERELLIDTQIEALRGQVMEVAEPDEKTLRAFYEENSDLFTTPPAYDLDIILIGVPPSSLANDWLTAEAQARTVLREIEAGGSFGALATKYSTHKSSENGGRLGKVHLGQLPEVAQEAIENLSPGQVSKPIRVLEGIAILRVNDRFDATLQPFDAVRERATAVYRRETGLANWRNLQEELKRKVWIRREDVTALVKAELLSE